MLGEQGAHMEEGLGEAKPFKTLAEFLVAYLPIFALL